MYQKTYFYINSSYKFNSGYPSDEAKRAFREETSALFRALGWEIEAGDGGGCDTATKGRQSLYLHPMEFSGVILAEEIPVIEAAIKNAKTFQLREIRNFGRYEDMSDEAYAAYLDAHREEMISAILTAYRTKRRDLFVTGDQSERIGKPFRVLRLASQDQRGDMAYDRVKQLIEELVADGRLATAQTRHGRGLRTAVPEHAKQLACKTNRQKGR